MSSSANRLAIGRLDARRLTECVPGSSGPPGCWPTSSPCWTAPRSASPAWRRRPVRRQPQRAVDRSSCCRSSSTRARRCPRAYCSTASARKALIVSGAALMAGGPAVAGVHRVAARWRSPPARWWGSATRVTFISVLRLVPHWFTPRQVPLVTQLTGICGQLGQVLSALPFLALLDRHRLDRRHTRRWRRSACCRWC